MKQKITQLLIFVGLTIGWLSIMSFILIPMYIDTYPPIIPIPYAEKFATLFPQAYRIVSIITGIAIAIGLADLLRYLFSLVRNMKPSRWQTFILVTLTIFMTLLVIIGLLIYITLFYPGSVN